MKKTDQLLTQITELASKVKKQSVDKDIVLIAIEGYGGAGKSTVANLLKDVLSDAYVIDFDDFLIKESISNADKSGFDKSRLEEQVLKPAKNGIVVKYQKLLWDENLLSSPIAIPKVRFLIIEGVSSYHPIVAHYYDFKIWIETDMDIAKQRGKDRDRSLGNNNDLLWENWAKTDTEYIHKYSPHLKADFVIYNTEAQS